MKPTQIEKFQSGIIVFNELILSNKTTIHLSMFTRFYLAKFSTPSAPIQNLQEFILQNVCAFSGACFLQDKILQTSQNKILQFARLILQIKRYVGNTGRIHNIADDQIKNVF